jgi:hypothetical protein
MSSSQPDPRTTPLQTGPGPDRRADQRPTEVLDGSHSSSTVPHDRHDLSDRSDRLDRREELHRQKEQFGGIKWGAAFFGWLTAIGTAVLLSGLAAAILGAIGLAADPAQVTQAGQVVQNPGAAQTAGIVGAIVALAVLFVAYYCGGYVAGRMARFSGAKQGVAVWVWTVIITILVTIAVAVAGTQAGGLTGIGGLPQIPVDGGALTAAGIITALLALAVSLVGAVLGGLAGMRFHRKIDRADLTR